MFIIKEFYLKKAFTLSEVLITLGVLGVVAAISLPLLVSNTRGRQYRSKLRKTLSSVSQAARMSHGMYGFDFAGIDEACQNGSSDHPEDIRSICSMLNGTLSGGTYIDKMSDLNIPDDSAPYSIISPYLHSLGYSNAADYHAYILSDGTIFAFYKGLGSHNGCPGKFDPAYETSDCVGFIDVNGVRLPNKEINCTSGVNSLAEMSCVVKNEAMYMTDIYPVRVYDGIVEPATAAGRFVLRTAN